ncbi:hypothetical protein [Brevundimonas diminuta]|uniref:hypothetical protein n=1 Tax=Brevundimonas diminuta TaxID=293 RepID=UPI001F5A2D70|nr:hypothetical protein [Brevundimonas diminuta]
MDSNRYGWYYGKTNMPIWIFLTPGRWWAELEFHLAGNGRLFLSGRRRRSVVWHLLYTLLFYGLLLAGIVYVVGGAFRSSDPTAVPAASRAADDLPRSERVEDASPSPVPETVPVEATYEEVLAPAEPAAPEPILTKPVDNPNSPSEREQAAEASASDSLDDLY